MAWVRQLANGEYRGGYRDAYGKRRTAEGTYRHKAAALRAANAKEEEARNSRAKDAPLTWGQWCDQWLAHRNVEESTRIEDEARIDKHIRPRWGNIRLTDITRADVKAWMNELKKDRAPATVNRIVGNLNTSLNEAVDLELIPANPAQGVRMPTGQATHERYLTKAEVDRVCANLIPAWRDLTYLGAYTGLRWGEAIGLQRKRVDLDRGMILVAEVWDDKAKRLKAYPKGRRRRSVPLPEWLHASIKDTDPVILSPWGKRPLRRNFQRALDDAAVKAKIERFRIHDLRHTYASWLIQAGVSMEEVRRLLGHESVQTTQRYAHLAEMPTENILAALR